MKHVILSKCNQRSFTLIELLVVISIIAILAGMLMPALAHARSVSRRAVCTSQIRQLHTAQIMYAADNQDFFTQELMGGIKWPSDNNYRLYWFAVKDYNAGTYDYTDSRAPLRQYVNGSVKVFMCPEAIKNMKLGDMTKVDVGCGYGYNAHWLGSYGTSSKPGIPIRSSKVKDPGSVVILGDSAKGVTGHGAGGLELDYPVLTPPYLPYSKKEGSGGSIHFGRHNKFAVIGFVDGHVEPQSVQRSELAEDEASKANLIGYYGLATEDFYRTDGRRDRNDY